MKKSFNSKTKHVVDHETNQYCDELIARGNENITVVTTWNGIYWESTITALDEEEALIQQLVEEHGLVRFFFTEEDINDRVQALFEDDFIPVDELTDGQMKHVKHVLSSCDCEYGLNWDSIDGAITDLFDDDSDPDEACERDREMHGTDGYENNEDWTNTEMIGI